MEATEVILRRVPEWQWNDQTGRPTSAAFKAKKANPEDRREHGISVDRLMNREIEVAIEYILFGHPNFGVVRLYCGDVTEVGGVVVEEPIESNPFHSSIYKNLEKERFPSTAGDRLSTKSVVLRTPKLSL